MSELCIERLRIEEFERCSNIWDMAKNVKLAETFYHQLAFNNRVTYICKLDGEFIAEASVVFDMTDPDYTVPGRRVYFSRFLVKEEYRGQGIGTRLAEYVIAQCRVVGLREISVGVDLENFGALKLYYRLGFNRLLFVGEDGNGRLVKLMKVL